MTIKEYLKDNTLIFDGAFGTYFCEKNNQDAVPEFANTIGGGHNVYEIHKEYIEAGARIIRTNTFATNSMLFDSFAQVKENVETAVDNAVRAVEDSKKPYDIYIAGDIGPIPTGLSPDLESLEEEYYRIAKIFIDKGIKIINFETFPEFSSILPAIRRIKSESDAFVMVSFSVNQYGYSSAGLSVKKLFSQAAKEQLIDAIGLNCGVGPGHLTQHMESVLRDAQIAGELAGRYVYALPNAGYPERVRNRIHFANHPEYFVQKMAELVRLGVDMAGGCCGTTPEHIRMLSAALNGNAKVSRPDGSDSLIPETVREDKAFYSTALKEKRKIIAVELAPPVNGDDSNIINGAKLLKNMGVDVLTFPDSPSGRTRVDSVLMAEKVKKETGMAVMPHICCRDKNAIAMRSTFLGAHINDIHNFLIITGDPVPAVTRQTVKAVFNFDSVGLMNIAKDMNEESFAKCPAVFGGAISQGRRNLDFEIKRVQKKMEAGATFFLTQPVFSDEDISRIKRIKNETGARILCGIMPLISRKNALFMKNEIAGVDVTDEIVEMYPENAKREDGEAVGIKLAKEIIDKTSDFADGYYFSFPFNRVYMLEKILEK